MTTDDIRAKEYIHAIGCYQVLNTYCDEVQVSDKPTAVIKWGC